MLLKCFTVLLLVSIALVAGQTEEEADALFDQSLLNTTGRPTSELSTAELSSSQLAVCAVARRKRQAGSISNSDYCPCTLRYDALSTFFQTSDWKQPSGCCPRSQYYDCGATPAQILPCFVNNVNGVLEWCCPVRRYTIYNCNCKTCIRNCGSNCFQTGTCRRRYTRQTVYAVCYNIFNGYWGRCRALQMSLPTRCSCSALCPIIGIGGSLLPAKEIAA